MEFWFYINSPKTSLLLYNSRNLFYNETFVNETSQNRQVFGLYRFN